MKALIICPGDRPAVAHLAENAPLAVAPLLGKSVIEFWLEALAGRGVKHLTVLASDRPHQVRAVISDGARWGLKLAFVTQSRELSVAEARRKFHSPDETGWAAEEDIVILDHLPGRPEHRLFESYAQWFSAVLAFMPLAVTPARIGAREV